MKYWLPDEVRLKVDDAPKLPQLMPEPPEPEQVDSVGSSVPWPERGWPFAIRISSPEALVVQAVEPLAGWRHVEVTERRTAVDFAEVLRWIVEDLHPEAEKVVLVMDNLNTHKLASLYEAFPPEQARRIAERLEIHHTPKHGSWLNVAEIELSILSRQCLNRRIGSPEEWNRGRATR